LKKSGFDPGRTIRRSVNVRSWPIAAEIHVPWNVSDQGRSGLVVLNVRLSRFDPLRTLQPLDKFEAVCFQFAIEAFGLQPPTETAAFMNGNEGDFHSYSIRRRDAVWQSLSRFITAAGGGA
jgi:hypothetical protein